VCRRGLSVTTHPFYVKDQRAAKAFYTDALGLEPRMDLPMMPDNNWCTVAPAGSPTEIMLFHDPQKAGGFSGMVFETDDIAASHGALAAKGVHFIEPPTPQEWGGVQALFTDIDDNVFVLVQRPVGMP
jgi:predicted enzyme related to lactoylglutathione lyase